MDVEGSFNIEFVWEVGYKGSHSDTSLAHAYQN